LSLFEPVQHFTGNFVRTGAPGGKVVEPVIDHLLGGRLLPDPLVGGPIYDFTSSLEKAPPATDTQLPSLDQPFVMTIERVGEQFDPFALRGDGSENRVLPERRFGGSAVRRSAAFSVRLVRPDRPGSVMCLHVPVGVACSNAQRDLNLLSQAISARTIRLVDHEDVADLHHARLEGLNSVSRFRHEHEHRGVGGAANVELRLAHADRLDEDPIEPCRIQHVAYFARCSGESAE